MLKSAGSSSPTPPSPLRRYFRWRCGGARYGACAPGGAWRLRANFPPLFSITSSFYGRQRSREMDFHLFFLKFFRELRFLFSSCCRSCSIFSCAFQAGHHFPCQDMILPVRVSGFSLAYRHRRHPSHALPRNCSSRFICNLQFSRKSTDTKLAKQSGYGKNREKERVINTRGIIETDNGNSMLICESGKKLTAKEGCAGATKCSCHG